MTGEQTPTAIPTAEATKPTGQTTTSQQAKVTPTAPGGNQDLGVEYAQMLRPPPEEQRQLTDEEREEYEKAVPQKLTDLPFMRSLATNLGVTLEEEKKKQEPPAAPEIKAADEAGAGKEGKDGKDSKDSKDGKEKKPKMRVKAAADTIREIAGQEVEQRMAEARRRDLPPLPPAQKEDPKPAGMDESKLPRAQRRELVAARLIEKRDPAQKGLADKLIKFYGEVGDYIAKAEKENPDEKFDESNEDFVKFVDAHNPRKWADGEVDDLWDEHLKEQAANDAAQRSQKEISEAKDEARRARLEPTIEKRMDRFGEAVGKELTSDDPFESEIYAKHRKASSDLAKTYLRLANSLEAFDPNNQVHGWISNYVLGKGREFARNGGDQLMRNGKRFVPLDEFAKLVETKSPELNRVWTFEPEDVISRFEADVILGAKAEVEETEKQWEAKGFKREKKKSMPKTEEPPKPSTGLSARVAPAPGLAAETEGAADSLGSFIAKAKGLKA